ncbi:unnamed protein product [Linum trigynum]|uniref:Uncharacterized protein n=1 Tax=Linum trigynum TaxID=586398 RepID=A0AAV2E983_9ROSI
MLGFITLNPILPFPSVESSDAAKQPLALLCLSNVLSNLILLPPASIGASPTPQPSSPRRDGYSPFASLDFLAQISLRMSPSLGGHLIRRRNQKEMNY